MNAAAAVAAEIRTLIARRNRAVGIFSSDPPQTEFWDELVKSAHLDWTRVVGFHLDEYLDLSEEAPQSSRRLLLERLVMRVPIAEFHPIRGEAANPGSVCANYSALLRSRPPDFAILGVGENGRLGSIDPGVYEFNEADSVRTVELAEDFRRLKFQEGGFRSIDEVPRQAISLTISALMKCRSIFAIARGGIRKLVEGEISPACPASILRKHRNAHLFVILDL